MLLGSRVRFGYHGAGFRYAHERHRYADRQASRYTLPITTRSNRLDRDRDAPTAAKWRAYGGAAAATF